MTKKIKSNPIHSARTVASLRAATARESNLDLRGTDHLAHHFAFRNYAKWLHRLPQFAVRTFLKLRAPGSYGFAIVRTRHFDAVLEQEIAKGIQQFVILGAGYDSRPLRYRQELANTAIFELDFPGTQSYKLTRMESAKLDIPENIVFIPIDFNATNFGEALENHGFSKNKKTFFLWEGVSYYLPEPVVRQTLEFVASCAAGSSIQFDYCHRDFLEGDRSSFGSKNLAAWLKQIGEPFLFGRNPGEMETYLREIGLEPANHLMPQELEKQYLAQANGKLIARTVDALHMVQGVAPKP